MTPYLVRPISIIEDSLFNNSKFSGPKFLADFDGFRANDVLPGDFDAGVVMYRVRGWGEINLTLEEQDRNKTSFMDCAKLFFSLVLK